MITLITCLLLIGFPLFGYVLINLHRQEKRNRAALRLSAILADDHSRRYTEAEAAELNNTRWDGD